MADYVLGGWTQSLADTAAKQFTYVMYGMVTNLTGLTTGTIDDPGWSPAHHTAPNHNGKVLWTYGGGGCAPPGMPANNTQILSIVAATKRKGWAGVDFDDECNMNFKNLIETMNNLKNLNYERSYTFIAGSAYNNPGRGKDDSGKKTNDRVEILAEDNLCDRFVLMCYGAEMWNDREIVDNVEPAIDRTLKKGIHPKKVILALTPAGLNNWKLFHFLDQVTNKGIGGLFVWDFKALEHGDLLKIRVHLGIN